MQWLATEGVDWVDVWRSDIDCPYDQRGAVDDTEAWFLQAVEQFLAGNGEGVMRAQSLPRKNVIAFSQLQCNFLS